MGNDAKKKAEQQKQQNLDLTSRMISQSQKPTPTETNFANFNSGMNTNFNNLYNQVSSRAPTIFRATRPGELNEAYGSLRSAGKGYQEFADTGGYSAKDQQELRARGMAPIRSAYGNATRELDRSRALGPSGGSANYIAAASKMQHDLPQQLSDATTNVNAGLADAIRQGKLAGLSGVAGVGSAMGGLSSDEANRILQAQGMTEGSYQNSVGNKLNVLGAQGTQGSNGFNSLLGAEGNRRNFGLDAIGSSMRQLQDPMYNQKPWWQKALGVAGKIAPYAAMAFGVPPVTKSS